MSNIRVPAVIVRENSNTWYLKRLGNVIMRHIAGRWSDRWFIITNRFWNYVSLFNRNTIGRHCSQPLELLGAHHWRLSVGINSWGDIVLSWTRNKCDGSPDLLRLASTQFDDQTFWISMHQFFTRVLVIRYNGRWERWRSVAISCNAGGLSSGSRWDNFEWDLWYANWSVGALSELWRTNDDRMLW